jgi:hypothetical protein
MWSLTWMIRFTVIGSSIKLDPHVPWGWKHCVDQRRGREELELKEEKLCSGRVYDSGCHTETENWSRNRMLPSKGGLVHHIHT